MAATQYWRGEPNSTSGVDAPLGLLVINLTKEHAKEMRQFNRCFYSHSFLNAKDTKIFDLKEIEYKTGFVLKPGFTLGELADGLAKELDGVTYSNGHKRFLCGHLLLPQVTMEKGGLADSTNLHKWTWNYLYSKETTIQTATEIAGDFTVDVKMTGMALSSTDCVIAIKKH